MDGRRRWPTPGGAALRSAMVPGWGQFAAGQRGRGLLLVVLALACAVVPLLVAAALLRPLSGLVHHPLLDRLAASSAATSALGDLLLNAIVAADWTVIWRGA